MEVSEFCRENGGPPSQQVFHQDFRFFPLENTCFGMLTISEI